MNLAPQSGYDSPCLITTKTKWWRLVFQNVRHQSIKFLYLDDNNFEKLYFVMQNISLMLYPILLIASSFRLTKCYSICNQGVTTLIIELQSRWVARFYLARWHCQVKKRWHHLLKNSTSIWRRVDGLSATLISFKTRFPSAILNN